MANKKSASGFKSQRPTSPHLQIYRWNVSSFTSILHRLTGVALFFSILALSWYITYYTYQINVADTSESCDCPLNQLINYAFFAAGTFITFALYYHFFNGIRHLFWDLGKGFEKSTARATGLTAIALAIIFTALTIGAVVYFKMS